MSSEKDTIVIKVTTKNPAHCYYVHFTRDKQTLEQVQEFKTIYKPWQSFMSARVKEVIAAARTRLLTTEVTEETTQ